MAELVKQNIVIPVGGLTQEKQTDGSLLGEETVNFYPDGEGYLVNYPGKTNYFKKLYGADRLTGVVEETTPLPTGTVQASKSYTFPPVGEMSRIFFYRDSANQQHIVFVLEKKLCVAEGNGYRVLRFFKGQSRDGLCYPKLFIHNNFLVIANLGDPILLWDGFSDVVPLGVTEAPNLPAVSVSRAPWYTNYGERKNDDGAIMMTSYWDAGWALMGGFFSKYGYWGNQGIWPCGPVTYEPGGHFHGLAAAGEAHNRENWNDTKWRWRVRYFDRYGNLGPLSAATGIVSIPKNIDLMTQPAMPSCSLDSKVSLRDWDGKSFATVYWEPPKHDWHIAGSVLYKTLDLHEDKGNSEEVFYVEYRQDNSNCCRHTSISGDSTLSASSTADMSVSGPPSTDLAASWGNRIIVRDPENKEKLLYSNPGQMGEFRSSNVYKAKDAIEALLPLGDRLLIVTRSTSEVLYYDAAGMIHHLETFEDKGSSYGPSFSVFGDQAFGLFNDGFFRFDGQKFTATNSPYYLEKDYIDRWHDIQNSVVQGEWYFLSIRKEMFSDENNYILMCHLPTNRWFQVKEEVRDMAVIGDYILGVKDTIYFLFRGDTYEDSTIQISGLLSSGVLVEKTLSSMAVMLEPASKSPMAISVSGADSFDKVDGTAVSYPSKSTVHKSVDYYPFYNDDKTSWGEGDDWVSPNDFHIRVNLDKNVTDFKHDITIGFSGPQRVKAVSFEYSVGGQIADKK